MFFKRIWSILGFCYFLFYFCWGFFSIRFSLIECFIYNEKVISKDGFFKKLAAFISSYIDPHQ